MLSPQQSEKSRRAKLRKLNGIPKWINKEEFNEIEKAVENDPSVDVGQLILHILYKKDNRCTGLALG